MLPRPVIIASLLGASVGVPYIASQTRQSPAGSPNTATAPAAPPYSMAGQPGRYAPPPAYSTGSALPPSSLVAPPLATTALSTTPVFASSAAPNTSAIGTTNLGSPVPGAVPVASATVAARPVAGATPIATQATVLPPTAAAIPTYPVTAAATSQDGARFNSVEEVLRFDISKEWVLHNWPRTSTGPTDVGLLAMRVPLVMGTQMSSLVGALTYFFNAQGQVEHITFHGRTGDARPLEQFLTQRYQFQPVASTTGEKTFQIRSGDTVFSELRLKPEAIIRSSAPQQSIVVDLEFARPGTQRVLPPHDAALQLPPGVPPASPQPPTATPAEKSADGAASNAASDSYWNRVHYASPAEERQLQHQRWPQ